MKRRISKRGAVIFLILLSVWQSMAFANTDGVFSVSADKTEIHRGETVTLHIYLNPTNPPLLCSMATYEVSYAPELFEITDVTEKPCGIGGQYVNPLRGTFGIVAISAAEITGNKPIQSVQIKRIAPVTEDAEVPFVISKVQFKNKTGLDYTIESAGITLHTVPLKVLEFTAEKIGDTVTAQTHLNGDIYEEKLYLAAYNADGIMTRLQPLSTADGAANCEFIAPEAEKVKLFLWKSDGITPLGEAKEIKL